MEITDTITIDAPVERVWALTVDLDRLPAITPTVTAVERLDDGPVTVGSRARLRQPGLPPRIWTVEVVDEPRRFAWATRLLGVRMVGVHDLTAIGEDRCELTLRVLLEGRGSGLLAKLGGHSIARSLAAENLGFAEAVIAAPA
jgi:uncharacterized protein YndB with AHSA1/START domain